MAVVDIYWWIGETLARTMAMLLEVTGLVYIFISYIYIYIYINLNDFFKLTKFHYGTGMVVQVF